ncbi:CBS domain-containing protein [Deltaproteobacteria bacterium TL4]
MQVKDFMSVNIITVHPDELILKAFSRMEDMTIHHLIVVDSNEKIVGILSIQDFSNISRLILEGVSNDSEFNEELRSKTVNEVMTENPVTITPEQQLKEAAKQMLWNGFHSLPVVENGELVGILTDRDILRAFGEMDE